MITGFGGIFWRTKNLEATKKWYNDALGLDINDWNLTMIKAREGTETIFSLFTEENDYFPTDQQAMLNFQVDDLDALIEHLEQLGVPLAKPKESSDYGHFAWIRDLDGRLIELWEK
ncbi:VOC family protein [Paenibacillus sp. MWE-103]|uniref:VOC family protein n=1 Tax=Paenibacillus artemisiicola TaxID=1172618 RepID=A0ABS3W4X9_9BACL|nr:VOC family protein [Paenibacillus artemisiicola]MBO7743363.1 VOC family protein [Paenibacillus artemisiicola]